jgi:hypothetical protein
MSAIGTKRTFAFAPHMSAIGVKRTSKNCHGRTIRHWHDCALKKASRAQSEWLTIKNEWDFDRSMVVPRRRESPRKSADAHNQTKIDKHDKGEVGERACLANVGDNFA